MKKSNGKILSCCNYCNNLVSINKLHKCSNCDKFYKKAFDEKLKINSIIIVNDLNELEDLETKNKYCENCLTEIRKNIYLCPDCLIKFHKNNVIFLIENFKEND